MEAIKSKNISALSSGGKNRYSFPSLISEHNAVRIKYLHFGSSIPFAFTSLKRFETICL